MLVIREQQMEVFRKLMRDQFYERAVTALSNSFPSAAATRGPDGMLALVRLGVARTREYGIKTEADVMFYLELMLTFGDNFDGRRECAWMRKILKRSYMSGPQKVQEIRDGIREGESRDVTATS
jgi:hypothetical protein